MNRNMRMLHNENNRLDKPLCEDYQRLMTDIVCYLRGADTVSYTHLDVYKRQVKYP